VGDEIDHPVVAALEVTVGGRVQDVAHLNTMMSRRARPDERPTGPAVRTLEVVAD